MRIGIIGAMDEEVAVLKEEMEVAETFEYATLQFFVGTLCGKEVIVVRSGIGKVNAALCAQILVDKFDVDVLMNTGIAGSLDAAIDIGDMVHYLAVDHLGYVPVPAPIARLHVKDGYLESLGGYG